MHAMWHGSPTFFLLCHFLVCRLHVICVCGLGWETDSSRGGGVQTTDILDILNILGTGQNGGHHFAKDIFK